MKIVRFMALVCVLCMCATAWAQKNCRAHSNTVPNGYPFWFYTPEEDESDDVHRPLLIFLHGRSLCGRNLAMVKRYGPIDALERGRVIDCYVIAPQNPGGAWNPQKIMNIIEWAEKNYKVDNDRIYVYGMSLGGYGTIDMAAAYPDRIACAMAMCGGGTSKTLENLSKVPLWIVHGTADAAVPVSASDRVVDIIRATGDDSRLIYTRMPGVNHGRPARIFYMNQTYDWMFSHSLKDEGRPINKDFEITTELMNNAYKSMKKDPDMDAFE